MKVFIAVLFFVALVVGAPVPCEHAYGEHKADGMVHAVDENNAHGDHSSHFPQMRENALHSVYSVSDHLKHGTCPMGCDGGYGCSACAVTFGDVKPFMFSGPFLQLRVFGLFQAMPAPESDFHLEPPPPKSFAA